MSEALPTRPPQSRTLFTFVSRETLGLILALLGVMAIFSLLTPRFLTYATFDSAAFQLPELGLLTLGDADADHFGRAQPRRHLHRQHLRVDPRLVLPRPRRA